MRVFLMFFLVLMSLFSVGCQTISSPNYYETKSSLTHGNITLNLKKGVTLQSEVLDIFGAPNIATTDAENREVWTYQKTARITEGSSSSGYATILLAGVDKRSASISQGSRTLTLIITFDNNDVVVDFKSRSTNF